MRGTPKHSAPKFGVILIADDHEVFRFGLAEVLRTSLGASRVVSVGTFQAALDALTDQDLSLAIFDLRIPGLDDPHDLSKIRHRRPDLRIIVLSGSPDRDDILAALTAGVHGYLVKNECTPKLVERIKRIMSGEIYVPPSIADLTMKIHDAQSPRDAVSGLTERQKQVLGLIAQGHSNKTIAKKLTIAESTVKMHIAASFRVIGANNRTQAAAIYKTLFG